MVSTHHQETRCRAVARTRRGPNRRRRSGCSQRRRRRSSGSRRARSSPCGRGRRAGGAGRWRGGRGPFDGAAREEGAGVGPARGNRGGGRCARAEAEMPHAVNGTTLTTDSTTNATSPASMIVERPSATALLAAAISIRSCQTREVGTGATRPGGRLVQPPPRRPVSGRETRSSAVGWATRGGVRRPAPSQAARGGICRLAQRIIPHSPSSGVACAHRPPPSTDAT